MDEKTYSDTFTKSMAKRALTLCKQFKEMQNEEKRIDHEAWNAKYEHDRALTELKTAKTYFIVSIVFMCIFVVFAAILWISSVSTRWCVLVTIVALVLLAIFIYTAVNRKRAMENE